MLSGVGSGSAVSGVGGRSAVSGVSGVSRVGEKIEKIEKKEEKEEKGRSEGRARGKIKRSVGAVSSASEEAVRSGGSGDTAGEAARGRAGHVGLQGGSTGPIPLFPLDEVFIHPDSGDQEAPRCLEPSNAYWTRLSKTERPSKGPKIRPTFGIAAEDRPLPFPTNRRVVRREVKDAPDLGTLESWASQVGLTVGAVADTEAKRKKALELCWTYRDMDSTGLDMLRVTDLVTHTATVREGARPYAARCRRRTNREEEEFMTATVDQGLQNGFYKCCMSPWDAAPRVVVRPDGKLRFTVNYRGLNKEELRSRFALELTDRIVDMLSTPRGHCYSKFDFSNAYFSVPLAEESQLYLAFSYPGGQVCPTTMPQGLGGSGQTCAAAAKIAFGPIPEPKSEPSLFGPNFGVYQDDLFTVHGNFEEQYDFLANHLFPRILWSGFSVGLRKVQLFMKEIEALGVRFEVGGKVDVKPDRVRKIQAWPIPEDPMDVRAFLGAMGICRRWIRNYSELARPLTRLTSPSTRWRWTETEDQAFQGIKRAIGARAQLFGPDIGQPCWMYAAAALTTGAVVICQRDPVTSNTKAGLRPILFDSVVFTETQARYSDKKREIYVIVHFLKKYRHLLDTHVAPSTVCTRDGQIRNILASTTDEAIPASWAVAIDSINVEFEKVSARDTRSIAASTIAEVVFLDDDLALRRSAGDQFFSSRFGNHTINEDKLGMRAGRSEKAENRREEYERWREWELGETTRDWSVRLGTMGEEQAEATADVGVDLDATESEGYTPRPDPSPDEPLIDEELADRTPRRPEVAIWERYQHSDWFQDIASYLLSGKLPVEHREQYTHAGNFRRKASHFRLDPVRRRLLYVYANGMTAPCVTEDEVPELLFALHDRHGHFADRTLVRQLATYAWWPTRAKDVAQYVSTCLACAHFGVTKRSTAIRPILTCGPFDMLGIDYIGPLDVTSHGNRYILHIIDYFTRFSFARGTRGNGQAETQWVVDDFCEKYATPLVVYSDRGTHFVGQKMQAYWTRKGIKHVASPSASPKSTGMVEVHNGLLEERIRRLLAAEPSKEWDQVLLRATRALNTREVRVHGYSPFQLLFGIPPRLNLPGDNPLLSEIHGNAALLIQLDGIRATLQSTEQGPVEEVLWAEAEREEVREEARQRRWAYAERVVAWTSRNLVKPGPLQPGDLVMLRDSAVAKEKGLKFFYRWTGPYHVRSVTQGGMSCLLQHPHEDKALYGTHHRDDVRLWTVRPAHLRYPPGAPIQPEFPTNLRQYRKGLLPHLAGKFQESDRKGGKKAGGGEEVSRKRRRV